MEAYQREGSSKVYIIDIVRFAACLMIFFYHCNSLLPGEFKFLTFFGEDMGNNLFFMLSGFALYPSIENTSFKELPAWYIRRLKRILPMLAFFYILSYLTGYYSFKSPQQLFTVFIYPTLYWFATGILVFYLILFVLMKARPKLIRQLAAAALMLLWILRADKMEGYYLIGFVSMLAGCVLREYLENRRELKGDTPIDKGLMTSFAASFLVYIIFKYLKFTGQTSIYIYIAVGAAVLATCLTALAAGYLGNKGFRTFFEGKEGLARFISYTGSLALPVYLVQSFNSGLIGFMLGQKIKFPKSFAVNFIVIWGAAIAVERAQSFLLGKINRQHRA